MSADLLQDRIADAIAAAEVGFSMELTRLVDGESTYTLTYDSGEMREFSTTEEVYAHVRQRKREHQAERVLSVLEATEYKALEELRSIDEALDLPRVMTEGERLARILARIEDAYERECDALAELERIENIQGCDADALIDAMLKAHDECRDLGDMLLGVHGQYRAKREATRKAVRDRMMRVTGIVTLPTQPLEDQANAPRTQDAGGDDGR